MSDHFQAGGGHTDAKDMAVGCSTLWEEQKGQPGCVHQGSPREHAGSWEGGTQKLGRVVEFEGSARSLQTGTPSSRRSQPLGMKNLVKFGWKQRILGCKNSRKERPRAEKTREGVFQE